MDIPFPMLKIAGGSKGAALLALLAGLYIVSTMQQQRQQQRGNTVPAPHP